MAKTSKPVAPAAPQPPYIKRAHLRNVPPLRDVKVDFKPGLNIIIGKNGSGKTNFMKLLSELAQPYDVRYRGIGCDFLLVGAGYELKIAFKENIPPKSASKSHNSLRTSASRMPLLVVASSDGLQGQSEDLMEAIFQLTTPSTFFLTDFDYVVLPIWHGLPFYRMPIIDEAVDFVISSTGLLRYADNAEPIRQGMSRLANALLTTVEGAHHFWQEAVEHKEPDILDIVRRFVMQAVDCHLAVLNSYLSTYSPLQEVRRSNQFQVYQNTSGEELFIKGLVLEYKIGGDWLPFSALSDGTKRVFYLVGDLVSASFAFFPEMESEPDFEDGNKIIFLEEPELGIHPDQLQLLLQLIREVSNEHQVIMTTHSPQTLDMLSAQELDRITICEFIPGKGTQMRKLSPAKKNKAKAYLRDSGFLSEFWRFSDLEKPD